MTDEAFFYICSPGKHRWVLSDDTYERTITNFLKRLMSGEHLIQKELLNFIFYKKHGESEIP